MVDLSVVNKFVSIATSDTIGADARISIARNAAGTEEVRATETTALSRLKERTFRSDADAATNRAARQELVNTLTGLFKVQDADHLPPAVRAAFVKGEVVCDRPLTQRRVSAVMTAAIRELGYKDIAGFETRMKMKAHLDALFGRGKAAEPEEAAEPEDPEEAEKKAALALTDDEMDSDFDEHIVELSENGGFADLGFTKEELQAYYADWKADIYAASAQKAQELATAAREQSPALIKLENIYGNQKEAARVVNNAYGLMAMLRLARHSGEQNDLRGQIHDAVKSALECVEKGSPKDSAVKKAAAFLRGVKMPPACTTDEMIKSITYNGIADGYKKMTAAVKKNIDTFMRGEANSLRGDGKSAVGAFVAAQLPLVKERMLALLQKLNPMGDDILDLSKSPENVRTLYNCATGLSDAEFAKVDARMSLQDMIEMINNRAGVLEDGLQV